ncbi:unnamed protein product [Sympodiomycopsis kandeliae]
MRVLVSGAGVAGPTLAYFLAKAGAKVTVVERAPQLLANGQNIDVDGGAITAIRHMGLFEELKRLNTTEIGTRFVDANGKPFASLPLPGPSATAEFEILRGDLAMMIYEASQRLDNVTYRFNTTVGQVLSNNQDGVKVVMNSGSDSSEKEEEYDLLVIADGQWSRLRKAVFPDSDIHLVDKDNYIAYFTIPREKGDTNWWEIYIASKSRLASIRPDSHGTTRAMLGAMPLNDEQRKRFQKVTRSSRQEQTAFLRETFAGIGWKEDRLLKQLEFSDDFYMHGLQQVKMKSWSKDRVVLLGDAAYAPTPLTGAGATLAIIGAYCLAGELSKLDMKANEHPARALQAYEALFKPHVDKVQDIPSFVPSVAHPNTWWHSLLLKTALSTISRGFGLWAAITGTSKQQKTYQGPMDNDGKRAEAHDDGFPLPEYTALQ